MRSISLLFVMLSVFLFLSCDGDDDVGSLKIKVIDDAGKPLGNARVILLDQIEMREIDNKLSDATGVVRFDEVEEGTYFVKVSASKDGLDYIVGSAFQLFAGQNKEVEYNPFANIGTFNISVKITGEVADLTEYKAALVSIGGTVTVESVKENASFSANIDKNGKVVFHRVPADMVYNLVIYKGNTLYVNKIWSKYYGEESVLLEFDVVKLSYVIKGEVKDYTKYTAYLIYNMYDEVTVENIKKNAIISGTLDSKGKLTLSEIPLEPKFYYSYLVKGNKIYHENMIMLPDRASEAIVEYEVIED